MPFLNCTVVGDCWEWNGPYGTHGYPRVCSAQTGDQSGHVVVAKLNGIYVHGLMVLHRCDNKRCLNPAHLYMGTNSENMRDRCLAGKQNTAVVSPEMVDAMRRFPGTRRQTAEHFGVSPRIVKDIRCGYTWKFI